MMERTRIPFPNSLSMIEKCWQVQIAGIFKTYINPEYGPNSKIIATVAVHERRKNFPSFTSQHTY